MDIPVNYLAVLVAAVANMVVGFAWYGPLFGKTWSQLMGWGEMTPEKMAEKQKAARMSYAISFVGALIMAYVLSHVLFLANAFAPSGFSAGITSGFWMWLGFIAPVTIGSVLWDGKPLKLWYINAGYYLIALLVMGAILGYWQ
ncbi:MAG: DUF1761 domain-containing protein [Minisyncoccia bacterium]